jgi:hypothetical protein
MIFTAITAYTLNILYHYVTPTVIPSHETLEDRGKTSIMALIEMLNLQIPKSSITPTIRYLDKVNYYQQHRI